MMYIQNLVLKMKVNRPAIIIINTTNNITNKIIKQKYERAKLRKFKFLVPPNENTIKKINPTNGIENRSSYPKYPHIVIG